MPTIAVCSLAELPPGVKRIVKHGRVEAGVFNVAGKVHAYRNVCPHAGAPVCAGPVSGTTLSSPVYEYAYGREGCILRCPWHGWEFDLETGEHLTDARIRLKAMPAEVAPAEDEALEKFPTAVEGGVVYLTLPGSA